MIGQIVCSIVGVGFDYINSPFFALKREPSFCASLQLVELPLKSRQVYEWVRIARLARVQKVVARIFPNEASCLRLVRPLAVEQHERWQEDHRYLNMAFLKEVQRERLNTAA